MTIDLPIWLTICIWLTIGNCAVIAGILLALGGTWSVRRLRRRGRKAGA